MQTSQTAQFTSFDASKFRVGIVMAQFNRDITEPMLEKALEMLERYRVQKESVVAEKVAGSVEIPVALQAMARSQKFDCLIALGCVIRGESSHFDYVCRMTADGIMRVMLDEKIPIGFGIITADTHEQAVQRIQAGAGATEAALQTAKMTLRYSS